MRSFSAALSGDPKRTFTSHAGEEVKGGVFERIHPAGLWRPERILGSSDSIKILMVES